MATLAEKEVEIQARVLSLTGPAVVSGATAMRQVNRYVAIKLVDGVEKEVFIDIAVHYFDTDDEMAVEIDTNIEPIEDPLRQTFIAWFNGEISTTDIVSYEEIFTANGPGVIIPRTKLRVWVLDPVTDEITERCVFAYMPTPGVFFWKFMTEVVAV